MRSGAVRSDADVPAVWQGLGLPGLLDVHVHFLPAPMLRKVWAYFDRAGEHYGRAWPVEYRGSDDERLAQLEALGVRRFPALCYPHKPGMARWLNDWSLAFADAHPQVLRSFTFYPEPSAGADVRAALEAGAQIGKLHVQVGGYDPTDPLLDEAWGLCAEAQVPLVVHCGDGPVPGTYTGVGPIAGVLARHPGLRIVIAHLGMPRYADFLDLAERHPGVHLDTTMAFTDFAEASAPFPPGERPRLVALQGRILLGSDFPNIPYPYATQVEALVRLDLGDGWLRDVLWHNASRLLGS